MNQKEELKLVIVPTFNKQTCHSGCWESMAVITTQDSPLYTSDQTKHQWCFNNINNIFIGAITYIITITLNNITIINNILTLIFVIETLATINNTIATNINILSDNVLIVSISIIMILFILIITIIDTLSREHKKWHSEKKYHSQWRKNYKIYEIIVLMTIQP